jgi:site-specific DNA recombinase
MRVGIYGRLSMDRDGTSTGTQRQLADCREYAQRRGWEVVDTWEESDVSAFNGKRRHEFERMVGALADGRVDGVIVWKLDRLSRQMRDFVRVVDAAEKRGAFIASAVEGISTNEPTGQFVAQLMTAQAQMESLNTSLRQKRKHTERAAAGLPHGGGLRMFGLSGDRREIVEGEAALLRDAARRITEGSATLEGICAEWNAAGVRTTTGRQWQRRTLRLLMQRPSLSGQREHRGEIVREWTGPAILTRDEGDRLRAAIAGRSYNPGMQFRWLLSGIARCSHCGSALAAGTGRKGMKQYRCHKRAGTPGCGRTTIARDPFDAFIIEAVIHVLSTPAMREAIAGQALAAEDAGAHEAIRNDEQALLELSGDYYQRRAITRAEFESNREAITRRLEGNRRKVQRAAPGLSRLPDDEDLLRPYWQAATVETRREIISSIIETITVLPGTRGVRSLDPARVQVVWRA